ncbi:MAG: hypothetical protein BWK73_10730 [Thiothrix lacustris]|uniref:DUF4124 domain-containing protein n=1 Tax=Thiothrix lacustris TaxID=525917 RepID=A0A1Y1QUG0_9GAMM|nr:MAG: hypothetical protein BWK73_10730 [Thiothrix lacustris]
MRVRLFSLLLMFGLVSASVQAEIYRWIDAAGNTVYGDNPPKQSAAKPVDLPILTVADSPVPAAKPEPAPAPAEEETAYTDFAITSPSTDEAIRANEGNVTVSVSLKPALKPGDGVALYLDSKQVGSGASLSFALTDIERGEHSVFAVLSNAEGDIIQNTAPVKFSVLRYSALQ